MNKFQNFLQYSMPYFNISGIDEDSYCQAMSVIILEAAQKALDLNVTFR